MAEYKIPPWPFEAAWASGIPAASVIADVVFDGVHRRVVAVDPAVHTSFELAEGVTVASPVSDDLEDWGIIGHEVESGGIWRQMALLAVGRGRFTYRDGLISSPLQGLRFAEDRSILALTQNSVYRLSGACDPERAARWFLSVRSTGGPVR